MHNFSWTMFVLKLISFFSKRLKFLKKHNFWPFQFYENIFVHVSMEFYFNYFFLLSMNELRNVSRGILHFCGHSEQNSDFEPKHWVTRQWGSVKMAICNQSFLIIS